MQPTRSYLICATPRSGSTLLCEALENTGLAGHPKEYFEDLRATGLPRRPKEYFATLENRQIIELLGDYSRIDDTHPTPITQSPATYAKYLGKVLHEGTTPNGIFGAKVMWGYFDDFISNLRDIPAYQETPVPELLVEVFPDLRYIWVTRLNKVRQAVSLWKAIQTSTWREDEQQSHESHHKPPKRELHFHFEAIDHLVQQIELHELAWQHFFHRAAIKPFTVIYEDLAVNYESTALRILQFLDIDIPENLAFAKRSMRRQADALSEEWVECYYTLKLQQEGAA